MSVRRKEKESLKPENGWKDEWKNSASQSAGYGALAVGLVCWWL